MTAEDYNWAPQACPICEAEPARFVGYRGGDAHRSGTGVKTTIWECRPCRLIMPNPMPFPKGGLEQHYDIEPSEYFFNHDPSGKMAMATEILAHAEALTTGRTLLDVGAGAGEILEVGVRRGWVPVGLEPSPTFAAHAEQRSGAQVIRRTIE